METYEDIVIQLIGAIDTFLDEADYDLDHAIRKLKNAKQVLEWQTMKLMDWGDK